jgi:hypothetical protein
MTAIGHPQCLASVIGMDVDSPIVLCHHEIRKRLSMHLHKFMHDSCAGEGHSDAMGRDLCRASAVRCNTMCTTVLRRFLGLHATI